jgi:hypothetical protein
LVFSSPSFSFLNTFFLKNISEHCYMPTKRFVVAYDELPKTPLGAYT